MGVIGGAAEGQAREEHGRRELGGGHLAGAFGRVRKAEVRPDEEARWQGQAVCPEASADKDLCLSQEEPSLSPALSLLTASAHLGTSGEAD